MQESTVGPAHPASSLAPLKPVRGLFYCGKYGCVYHGATVADCSPVLHPGCQPEDHSPLYCEAAPADGLPPARRRSLEELLDEVERRRAARVHGHVDKITIRLDSGVTIDPGSEECALFTARRSGSDPVREVLRRGLVSALGEVEG